MLGHGFAVPSNRREQYESALIFRRLVNARSIAESQDRSVVPEHTALRKEDHRPRQLAEGIAGQGCVIVGGDQRRAAGGYQLLGHFSSRQAQFSGTGTARRRMRAKSSTTKRALLGKSSAT